MNKLIKMAVVAAGIGAMLGFAGCGDGGNSPESVVQRELEGWIKANDPGNNTISSKITKCEVTGESAVVSFVITIKGAGDSPEQKRELKKVNGKWINPKNTFEYWVNELTKKALKDDGVKGKIDIKYDSALLQKVESNHLKYGNGDIDVIVFVDGKRFRTYNIIANWEAGTWEKSTVLLSGN